jgi:glucosamine-6-phosphate deaminase
MTDPSSTLLPEADLKLEIAGTDEWPAAVAGRWARFLAAQPGARICLPTGSTPRPMYRSFAESGGDLSGTTIFLLDEFGLPAGAGARCEEMIRRDLLDLLAVAPAAVHTIDVEASDLEAESRRYEAAVRDGGLALTMLGLGRNGHLGLNEPGSALDTVTRVVQLTPETGRNAEAYGSDAPATWGVTLGMDTLLASDELWLLVTGPHKAAILARTIKGDIGAEVPATFLRTHPNVTVFADEPAAALL